MRPNSLDLNSFRADFWRRSMRSSPLRSITSSLISSVVFARISFISSSRFAIFTIIRPPLAPPRYDSGVAARTPVSIWPLPCIIALTSNSLFSITIVVLASVPSLSSPVTCSTKIDDENFTIVSEDLCTITL
ncbi:hypothetical protein B296_00011564 [Ensete ventricosum]|uniref:Uncharacterized protein n=1 Tax=Ensete ventricosum TaxID=4639 RepID=A0A427A788_ENSVE|nr:hypothetical protein B296_00011564 [Ensete ventricosum]